MKKRYQDRESYQLARKATRIRYRNPVSDFWALYEPKPHQFGTFANAPAGYKHNGVTVNGFTL